MRFWKRIGLVGFVLISVVLSSCLNINPEIQMRVLFTISDKPIPFVRVSIGNKAYTANADGIVVFKGKAGSYIVKVLTPYRALKQDPVELGKKLVTIKCALDDKPYVGPIYEKGREGIKCKQVILNIPSAKAVEIECKGTGITPIVPKSQNIGRTGKLLSAESYKILQMDLSKKDGVIHKMYAVLGNTKDNQIILDTFLLDSKTNKALEFTKVVAVDGNGKMIFNLSH